MRNKNNIVSIPVKMEKFYGKGTMLHPSADEIEALIKTIPQGSLATIDALCKRLANDTGVNVTCPMRTGNAIKKISEQYSSNYVDTNIPFWRVIKSNKQIIKSKNYELWASKIEDEGFELDYTKLGLIKVNVDDSKMFSF